MSALLHAIVVARATGSSATAADQLRRTLEATRAQSRTLDAVTVVACGKIQDLEEIARIGGATNIIKAPDSTSFAAAVSLAEEKVPAERSIWLLSQGTEPEPGAVAALAGALERGPSVAIAAPKLVDAGDPSRIVSLGVSMTRFGRMVPLANGEMDQGQHDTDDDVLGADIRGLLIRADQRQALVIDAALGGADEGLDLGVRARLAGGRVALAPAARIAVTVGGEGDLPRGALRRAYAVRTAQLHRRLAYAPALAVPLHWLLLLPLALWRTMVDLVAKRPRRVLVEWAAAFTVLVRFASIARSRGRIRRFRSGGWSQVDPLRASAAQLRERYDDGHVDPVRERDLGFFSGGGAWAVLGGLAVSVGGFFSLLAWPALGGGALLPLSDTVGGLWRGALYGQRPLGLDEVTAADPFSALVALIGSIWPVAPSFMMIVLWILAIPLGVLGGWFAATRVSDRAGVRVFVGIAYALAPTLLAALTAGLPAAVLTHLLLPWAFFTAAVAHRSWGASGAASLLLLGVLAAAPSLAPAIAVAWVVLVLLTIVMRARAGIARVIWLVVPAAVWFAPIVAAQLGRGTPFAAFADPGTTAAGHGAARDWLLAAGFPTADPAGWLSFLGPDFPVAQETLVWVIALFAAPLALLALAAPATARWRLGSGLVLLTVLGLAGAIGAVGVQVAFSSGDPVALWPGTALSLAWLGACLAAAVTLDVAPLPGPVRVLAGFVAVACVAVLAVPGLTAVARDDAALTNGPTSTLPAYVGAEAAGDADVGTLIIAARDDGSVAARVVWGESETLGGQSTLEATDVVISDDDRRIAELTGDLVSGTSADAAAQLGEFGLRFVLLADGGDLSDAARSTSLEAVTAIDQRDGFARVGQTARGMLWRLDADPEARQGLTTAERATAGGVLTAQAAILLAAILLSVPTGASRRAARGMPTVLGRGYEEKR
ncbi:glycosyltransferase [Microbacterium sp.]|uniref:glycosyltransferase n=1 Tax=Microbacterium sp. TaxID=51671 RepID=UPI003F9C903B